MDNGPIERAGSYLLLIPSRLRFRFKLHYQVMYSEPFHFEFRFRLFKSILCRFHLPSL